MRTHAGPAGSASDGDRLAGTTDGLSRTSADRSTPVLNSRPAQRPGSAAAHSRSKDADHEAEPG